MIIKKSTQKHPRCKKGWPRTKIDLAEKDVKSNGLPMPPGFDRFENFDHDNLTANIVIAGAQSLLILMGSKFLDQDDQAAKHQVKRTVFCGLVIFIKNKNFDPINIRRP